MTPRVKRLAIVGVGALVLVGVGGMAYNRVYAEPMAKARADLARWERTGRAYERDLDEAPLVGQRLREVAATALGRSQEEVAHRFRTLLGDTAAVAGLSQITVTEGRTGPELNPATHRFNLAGIERDARHTSDFWVMNGEVKGTGSLEAVARMLELCETQPWLHRVPGFSVTPVGEERREFEVKVSVATLFMPDMGPPEGTEFAVTPLAPGSESAWASIVARNVFRLPDPPAAEPPPVAVTPTPVQDVPPAAPPQPYHEWMLSGVMEGASVSVVMVNQARNQSVRLVPGESVLDARLVRAEGESAVFAIGDQEFEVRLRQSLAERAPVDGSGGV